MFPPRSLRDTAGLRSGATVPPPHRRLRPRWSHPAPEKRWWGWGSLPASAVCATAWGPRGPRGQAARWHRVTWDAGLLWPPPPLPQPQQLPGQLSFRRCLFSVASVTVAKAGQSWRPPPGGAGHWAWRRPVREPALLACPGPDVLLLLSSVRFWLEPRRPPRPSLACCFLGRPPSAALGTDRQPWLLQGAGHPLLPTPSLGSASQRPRFQVSPHSGHGAVCHGKHSLWPVRAECPAQHAAVLPEPHRGQAVPAAPCSPAGLSPSLPQ